MAISDYRLCDKCGRKAFYDASLDYDFRTYTDTGLWNLGDWTVLCRECAKQFECVVVKRAGAEGSPPRAETEIERLRQALAMAPTPGPWVVDRLSGSGRLQVNAPSSHTVAIICHNVYIPEEVHAANAAFIAACDPDTVRALLAERDELLALAKRMLAAWEGSGPGIVLDDIRALIAKGEGRSDE